MRTHAFSFGLLLGQWCLVEVMLEDGGHAFIGITLQTKRPPASGLQALGPVGLGQSDEPEAGAEALLRMDTAFEQGFDERVRGLNFASREFWVTPASFNDDLFVQNRIN